MVPGTIKFTVMPLLAYVGVGVAVFALIVVLGYRLQWRWTGLTELRSTEVPGTVVQPSKTLWDWLQLLVIPGVLALAAIALNNAQSGREQGREDRRAAHQRRITLDARRDEALNAYLAQMSDLMLRRKLTVRPSEQVVLLARTLTLAALRRLDGGRRGQVIRFLYEAPLIGWEELRPVLTTLKSPYPTLP
jgi:hypothetical protein